MGLNRIDFRPAIWLICAVFSSMHSLHAKDLRNMIESTNIFVNDSSDGRFNDDGYISMRKQFIDDEIQCAFGSDIRLNKQERRANAIIMAAKEAEYANVLSSPHTFTPSRHIFETLTTIKQSKLFRIIQKMPKGGILHAHDTAFCSADFIVSLTYWPHLWQLSPPENVSSINFLFSLDQPNSTVGDHVWRRVSGLRHDMGAKEYDKHIRKYFTLYDESVKDPKIQFGDINEVWNKFKSIFANVGNLLKYAPIWKANYKQALKESLEDGVQYLEMRSPLPTLYDLYGTVYTEEDNLRLYMEALAEFKQDHPDFIGSKIIYGHGKSKMFLSNDPFFETAKKLHAKFSDFMVGIDLVGQEDIAPKLVSFVKDIQHMPADMNFFFHAGETNWFGGIDENLIDAVLLGTKRIGHGYGLAKHPKLIELIKERNIAIEINPVSNQVLKLVDDYRNHPASVLLAQNVSLVVSSDDPSFWEVSKLSHDFYMAFLGIASRHNDLRTLKKLAINSIVHSGMSMTEKSYALIKWESAWDAFIEKLVNHQFEHI